MVRQSVITKSIIVTVSSKASCVIGCCIHQDKVSDIKQVQRADP